MINEQDVCEHDYEPVFAESGRDIYECIDCGKRIDMTEDDDCEI